MNEKLKNMILAMRLKGWQFDVTEYGIVDNLITCKKCNKSFVVSSKDMLNVKQCPHCGWNARRILVDDGFDEGE